MSARRGLATMKRPLRSTTATPAVAWSKMARKRSSLSRIAASARRRSCDDRLSASPTASSSRRLVSTGPATPPAPPMSAAARASSAIERDIHSPAMAAPTSASTEKNTRFQNTCWAHSCIGACSTGRGTDTTAVQPLSRRRQLVKLCTPSSVVDSTLPSAAYRGLPPEIGARRLADEFLVSAAAGDDRALAVDQSRQPVLRDGIVDHAAQHLHRQRSGEDEIAMADRDQRCDQKLTVDGALEQIGFVRPAARQYAAYVLGQERGTERRTERPQRIEQMGAVAAQQRHAAGAAVEGGGGLGVEGGEIAGTAGPATWRAPSTGRA